MDYYERTRRFSVKGLVESSQLYPKISLIESRTRTITELCHVPSTVKDGVYGLNLQMIAMEVDAVPSRPVLVNLENIKIQ